MCVYVARVENERSAAMEQDAAVTTSNEDDGGERDNVSAAAASFDFVRFTLSDIHGISRSKLIPRSHVDDALKNGVGICAGKKLLSHYACMFKGSLAHRHRCEAIEDQIYKIS